MATYAHQDASLRELAAPASDAEELANVLSDPELAGFDVSILVNEPHYVVGERIGEFYADCRRDDLAMLYFTGHGLKDDAGDLFLAMANTRRGNLAFTALAATQLNVALDACRSRRKILILDCCYSGAFPAGVAAKGDPAVHTLDRFQGQGRVVLTASDATQYSFEGDQLNGSGVRSLFTRYLVEGICTGAADLDNDGDVSLDELYDYVRDRVVQEMPQQRPKKMQDVDGRIIISRNPNWALPNYIIVGLSSPLFSQRLVALEELVRLHQIGNSTVQAHVQNRVEQMIDDDSRMVSAKAISLLQGWDKSRLEYSTCLPTPRRLKPARQHFDQPEPGDSVSPSSGLARPGKTANIPSGHSRVIRYSARADRGLYRRNNQDAVYAGPHLLAIADGHGHGQAGGVASSLVIGALAELDKDAPGYDLHNLLLDAILQANAAIARYIAESPDGEGMGTTVTAMMFSGAQLALAHIGNSRAFMLRDGNLFQITEDTFDLPLVESDVEELAHLERMSSPGVITGGEVAPSLSVRETHAGDRYLLCTDGLSGIVPPKNLAETMAAKVNPRERADRLIHAAMRGGGQDNITVIVADVMDIDFGKDIPIVALPASAES